MATKSWLGQAQSTAQVWKGTIASSTAAQTFILTFTDLDIGGTNAITYTVQVGDTTTTIATAVKNAINASPLYMAQRVTATTDGAAQVILTADTAGEPFSVAASGTGTWSGTGNTTTSSGPNDFGIAANFSDGAVPGANDTVYVPAGAPSILYNLDFNGTAINNFYVQPGFSGNIGRWGENARLYYLQLDADVIEISGSGSLIAIDNGGTTVTPRIDHVGSPSATGRAVVYLKGTGITSPHIENGVVGFAFDEGSTATVATSILAVAGTVYIGSGCTVTGVTMTIHDAAVESWASVPTIIIWGEDGTYRQQSGNWTTATANRGRLYPNANGTYATTKLYNDAAVYNTEDMRTKTFTDTTFGSADVRLHDPLAKITLTNAPTLLGVPVVPYGTGTA